MKKMKKVMSAVLVVAMVVVMFAATPAVTAQAKVKILAGKKLTLAVGDSDYVLVKGKATYKTSNKKIATVSKKGEVKAKAVGTCKITVTQNGSKATAKITVVPAKVSLKSVVVSGKNSAETLASKATILATWKKAKGASGYYVYYSTSKTGKYTKKTVKGAKKTSLSISGLAYGKTYFVKVKAFGGKKKTASTAYSKVLSAKTYLMKWNDEFSGTAIDSTKWHTEGATGAGGYGNKELQNYQPEYAKVENGSLVIMPEFKWNKATGTAVKDSYYSTKLWTRGKHSFKYGKFEFRAKLPKGQGTWAACWMLGNNNSWPTCGEIDVLETTSQLAKTKIPQTIHCEKYNGMGTSSGPKHYDTIVPTATSAFHTYGIEWTESKIDFYIDGKKTGTYDPNNYDLNNKGTSRNDIWPYKQPFYLIINCAIGGTLGGNPGTAYWTKIATNGNIETYQDYMYVDYVRVYQ